MNQTGKFNGVKCDKFFAKVKRGYLSITFDDVLLVPGYSDILPHQANVESRFSRNIQLLNPIVSAPMDTVTEYKMAIAMAMNGALGIIHKGLDPIQQAAQVAKVKHRMNAFIIDPICVKADEKVADVLRMLVAKDYGFTSLPVVDDSGRFRRIIGVVTGDDFTFCRDKENTLISQIMSRNIISGTSDMDIKDVYNKMFDNHKKILPILGQGDMLKGIYTLADVERIVSNNNVETLNLDSNGNLFVGAAVGVTSEDRERAYLLASKGVNVFVIDTAHGHSVRVIEMVKYLKRTHPEIDVVAGNISQGEAAKCLVKAGVDGIKIGQGSGSICSTRIISGYGYSQLSAVYECARAIRGCGVPICADGGIRYSGDITKAIAAGADNVMLGGLLAATLESPGTTITKNGVSVKVYRGMGSLEAMNENKSSSERYGQSSENKGKFVPEGVVGTVQFKGGVGDVLYQLIGGLRSGMGYGGVKDIPTLQKNTEFSLISASGGNESHPHDLYGMEDAPNYKGR
ncbi:MAG: IMP dehydrogenase [Patescibacteria group bacterium]|jgi:IMP dehydrogenase